MRITSPREYLTDYAWAEEHDLAFYASATRGLPQVIANAVQGRVPVSEFAPRGIHSHWTGNANRHWHPNTGNQRRLARALATRADRLRSARDFDQLWWEVVRAASEGSDPAISTAGAEESVIIFDVAVFIGAYLGLRPTVIYLHAGAREGARKLLGAECIGTRRTIPVSELPPDWQCLDALQAETALCAFRRR